MKKKYAIFPGYIMSRTDREDHYITADKLMRLYGVTPAECVIIWHDDQQYEAKMKGSFSEEFSKLIQLYPNFYGEYKLPEYKE